MMSSVILLAEWKENETLHSGGLANSLSLIFLEPMAQAHCGKCPPLLIFVCILLMTYL